MPIDARLLIDKDGKLIVILQNEIPDSPLPYKLYLQALMDRALLLNKRANSARE